MLANDRRKHKRSRRLVTATLRFGNTRCDAVSVDVSSGGGFFYSAFVPPTGSDVVLEIKDASMPAETIQLCSHVVRLDNTSATANRKHGFGVRWVHVTGATNEPQIRTTLERVLGVDRLDVPFRNPGIPHRSSGINERAVRQPTSTATSSTTVANAQNRTESPFETRRSTSVQQQTQPVAPAAAQRETTHHFRAVQTPPGSNHRSTTNARPVSDPSGTTDRKAQSGVHSFIVTDPVKNTQSRVFAAPPVSEVHVTAADPDEYGFGTYNGMVVTTPLPYVSWNSEVFRIGAPVRIVSGEQVAIGRVDSADSPERIHVMLEGKPLRAGTELSIAAPAKVRGQICAHEVRAQVVESTIGEWPSVTLACLSG